MQGRVTAETFSEEKTVATKKIDVKEENIQVQQRIPITILSEDEGYILEEDEFAVKTDSRVNTYREGCSQEDEAKRSKKKKTKVIAMDFATIKHQGKSLKMLGELASTWRPKTRPRNKLRLSMNFFLNPR